MVLASSTEVAQRLVDWSNGNKAALDRLMPLVYKELLFGFTLYSDKMTVNSVTRYRTASGSDRRYATAPLNIVRAGRLPLAVLERAGLHSWAEITFGPLTS